MFKFLKEKIGDWAKKVSKKAEESAEEKEKIVKIRKPKQKPAVIKPLTEFVNPLVRALNFIFDTGESISV